MASQWIVNPNQCIVSKDTFSTNAAFAGSRDRSLQVSTHALKANFGMTDTNMGEHNHKYVKKTYNEHKEIENVTLA